MSPKKRKKTVFDFLSLLLRYLAPIITLLKIIKDWRK